MTKTLKAIAIFALTPLLLAACTQVAPTTEQKANPDPATQVEIQEERVNTVQYLPYSQESYDSFLASEPFALFFHAEWCPTCRAMEEAILDEMDTFPEGTKILKVNYDTETELKTTYEITSQSTVVIVDKEGTAVKTLAAPNNKKIINNLKKVM